MWLGSGACVDIGLSDTSVTGCIYITSRYIRRASRSSRVINTIILTMIPHSTLHTSVIVVYNTTIKDPLKCLQPLVNTVDPCISNQFI